MVEELKVTSVPTTYVMDVGRAYCVEPSSILCTRNGEILQLWYERGTQYKEWRALPTFEEASKTYGSVVAR